MVRNWLIMNGVIAWRWGQINCVATVKSFSGTPMWVDLIRWLRFKVGEPNKLALFHHREIMEIDLYHYKYYMFYMHVATCAFRNLLIIECKQLW